MFSCVFVHACMFVCVCVYLSMCARESERARERERERGKERASVGVGVNRSYLEVEQDGSQPHGLADLHAVAEEGEAWGALVVGGQHFNIHRGDRAPGSGNNTITHLLPPTPHKPWAEILGREGFVSPPTS